MRSERFKTKAEAVVKRTELVAQGIVTHIYKGHRHFVLQWWV